MSKKNIFTEETLKSMGLVKNSLGQWQRPKTVPQPREIDLVKIIQAPSVKAVKKIINSAFEKEPLPEPEYHSIRLVLKGEPMPKQSVRSTKSGHHFQPKKYVDREKDYRKQIADQLPKGFVMFTQEVKITKLHFVYAPLKKFQKMKGYMDKIHSGELIPKVTAGDCDNLMKLCNDSLSELVFKDDALIYHYSNMGKYYGTAGYIEIELTGK